MITAVSALWGTTAVGFVASSRVPGRAGRSCGNSLRQVTGQNILPYRQRGQVEMWCGHPSHWRVPRSSRSRRITLRLIRGNAADKRRSGEAAYPLVATFLLTGGRLAEVLGLELDDISFDRRTVTFRPNAWRRVKTQTSWRHANVAPPRRHPAPYVDRRIVDRGGRLLFPAFAGNGIEPMLVDSRKLLDQIAKRAGWKAGEIRHRIFRHT